MKISHILIATLLLIYTLSARAGLEEGKAAFESKKNDIAMGELLPLAESGNAEAQSLVAYLYKNMSWEAGKRELSDYWFTKAAAQDEPFAMFEIGITCKMIPESEVKQLLRLCPASNFSDKTETLLLSEHYFNKARAIFEVRAKNGDSKSQFYLGNMYAFGNGVLKNGEKGEYWLTESVKQGKVDAAGSLFALFDDYVYLYNDDEDYLLEYKWWIIWNAMISLEYRFDDLDGLSDDYLKKSEKSKAKALVKQAEVMAKQWLKQNGRKKELMWVNAHALIPAKPFDQHRKKAMAWFKSNP
jgi:TPR repeat protein